MASASSTTAENPLSAATAAANTAAAAASLATDNNQQQSSPSQPASPLEGSPSSNSPDNSVHRETGARSKVKKDKCKKRNDLFLNYRIIGLVTLFIRIYVCIIIIII